jgi:succinate dehydrogenase/fumarate reductase flavoprotein subunit
MSESRTIAADVLVIGAGAAGMYAAIAAARAGASVLLLDKSLVGRGGATIMAQMTVAAAIGSEEPDDWTIHLTDTLRAGRELCNQDLARALCRDASERIMEADSWGIGWARQNGQIKQVQAPGHSRKRCVYVDILNTGPATARTLQAEVFKQKHVRRISNVIVTDLVISDERCIGAVGLDLTHGKPVRFHAAAVVLAAGGLTRLFARNSASINMTGDAYALALRAGADLIDMEFVQFFPIAHLAPRLVGMDPIMWDPFRYKLGGRLLNGRMEEFLDRYGAEDGGRYVATRDVASYAILKEVEAGRGSPHGGAYLDFSHVPEVQLRDAFGSVIDRLQANGIDLTQEPVEVAPMAHYHMGGLRCNDRMETTVAGLYGAGEAVGGAHGATRLSGNAITEAFVFGERAGRYAAEFARGAGLPRWDEAAAEDLEQILLEPVSKRPRRPESATRLIAELQELMSDKVGPLRSGEGIAQGLGRIRELRLEVLPALAVPNVGQFNMEWQSWLDLRNMLETAEAVAAAAFERRESRGAHVRLDFPDTDAAATANLVVHRQGSELSLSWNPVVTAGTKLGV